MLNITVKLLFITLLLIHRASANEFTFQRIDFPNSSTTYANDINDKGDIIGLFTYTEGGGHAFIKHDDQYSFVDYPGATVTYAEGLNNQGI